MKPLTENASIIPWAVAAADAVARRAAQNTPWGGAEGQGDAYITPPAPKAVPAREPTYEARMIVPQDHAAAQLRLEADFLAWFGGYTASRGRGAWNDLAGNIHYDAVWIFDIAMEASERNIRGLRILAQQAAREMKQQAIYLRLPNGSVEFVGK